MNGICQYCGADRSGPSAEAHSKDCPEEREAYASSRLAEVSAQVREFLWLNHGHQGLYGDDGQMQCSSCGQFGIYDYKNEPLEKVFAAAKSSLATLRAEVERLTTQVVDL